MANDRTHQRLGLVEARAEELDTAQRAVTAIAQLSTDVSLVQAYDIQRRLISHRVARGERLSGVKLGFTSRAKMVQMGVSEVIAGRLTDAMQIPAGQIARLEHFIHPRIEPEVAFRVSRDVGTGDDIVACIDAVAPALEIIDSRYRDFRFSLCDVVADNASSAAFVIGEWRPIDDNANDQAVDLLFDGAVVERGSTAAILGDPLDAVRQLTPLIERYGFELTEGDVILAGAATAAAALRPAVVEARVGGLGSVRVVAV